jgi:hypothetical protein
MKLPVTGLPPLVMLVGPVPLFAGPPLLLLLVMDPPPPPEVPPPLDPAPLPSPLEVQADSSRPAINKAHGAEKFPFPDMIVTPELSLPQQNFRRL